MQQLWPQGMWNVRTRFKPTRTFAKFHSPGMEPDDPGCVGSSYPHRLFPAKKRRNSQSTGFLGSAFPACPFARSRCGSEVARSDHDDIGRVLQDGSWAVEFAHHGPDENYL